MSLLTLKNQRGERAPLTRVCNFAAALSGMVPFDLKHSRSPPEMTRLKGPERTMRMTHTRSPEEPEFSTVFVQDMIYHL